MLMSKSFYHKITDEQWKIIEQHLPKPKSTGRPGINPRTAFNAIFWMLDSGAKWRYMPKEFGSIYHIFRKWIDWGVFEKILQSLVENSRKYFLVEIDSTFCKVHQHAAGARKILGNQNIEVSRGGKTTKIHALVNEHFQLVGISLSKVTLEGKKILADKGYCSEEIRNFISQEKAEVCIPDKSNAIVIHNLDKELYKSRNIIERFFQRIKNYRHVATRYDKLSNCFLNFIILAAVMIQI